MKKYLYLVILAFAITSCDDVLNTTSETSISDESVITDSKSSLSALIGVYDAFTSYYGSWLNSVNVLADNVDNYTTSIIIPTLDASSGGGAYSSAYSVINRANFVITKTSELTTGSLITEANKKQYVGEAYFLRALVYFNLVRTYGGVPIIVNPTISSSQDDGIKRSTVAETYAQVLSDLDKAEELLTTTVVRNRANLYSVYALKARFYLYNENWDEAEIYATKVISDNSDFTLVKPFSTFFTTTKSKESVFELTFNSSDKNPVYTNYISAAEGGRLDYKVSPDLVPLLLSSTAGGTRSSLIKLLSGGYYEVIQYGTTGTSSLFVLRLSEQYLIRAEARIKKSNPDLANAIFDLNQVRTRSDVPSFVATNTTTANDILLALENERRYEFAFEGHRFNDIVRTKRAATVFGSLNSLYTDPGRWVYPIPYDEIVADPDLDQNDAYN